MLKHTAKTKLHLKLLVRFEDLRRCPKRKLFSNDPVCSADQVSASESSLAFQTQDVP